MLPCGHLLWAFSELFGPEAAYPPHGIHFRWLRVLCEEPDKCPPRTDDDGPAGLALGPTQVRAWQTLLLQRCTPEDGPSHLAHTGADDDGSFGSPQRSLGLQKQRSLSIRGLIETIYELNNSEFGNKLILTTLANSVKECSIAVADYYRNPNDPNPNPLVLRVGRQSQQRAGTKKPRGRNDFRRIADL